MQEIKLPFLVKTTLVLISILIFGFLVKIGKVILAPLFFAFLLALLFVPLSNFLEKHFRFSRSISTIFSFLLFTAFLFGIGYFFVGQLSGFINDFPQVQKQVSSTLEQLQSWVSHTFDLNVAKQMDYLNQGLEKLVNATGLILGVTFGMLASTSAFFGFTMLFFIFILNYRRTLYQFISTSFNVKYRVKVREIATDVERVIKQYILGLIIQIIIVSILTAILLTFMDVKYAILLAMLTGILNVIPYVGIITSWALVSIIAFATGGSSHLLFLAVGYIGIHAIDANIVLPLVVGSKVKINALFTFIALLVGESLWGIAGMFLSIPFLAILKIIFEHVEGLEPWGMLLGETKSKRPKKKYKITKTITLEEKD